MSPKFFLEPKRTDKARTPPADNQDGDRQNTMDEPPNQEPAYRSSSPPIPAIQNRGKKKKKTNDTRVNYSPPNDAREDQPRSPPTFDNANNTRSRGNELEELNENENENENENDDDRENNNEPQDESQHDPPVSGSEKTKSEKRKGLSECLLKLFKSSFRRFALHRTACTQKESSL